MSNANSSNQSAGEPGGDERLSALFASLVMQQANMAMTLMGKVADPESGKPIKDLEAAQLFIDYLEMLEVKTRNNLTKAEAALLKQSLMSLRLAFVQAVESPAEAPAAPPPDTTLKEPKAPEPPPESGKKFSKKY